MPRIIQEMQAMQGQMQAMRKQMQLMGTQVEKLAAQLPDKALVDNILGGISRIVDRIGDGPLVAAINKWGDTTEAD